MTTFSQEPFDRPSRNRDTGISAHASRGISTSQLHDAYRAGTSSCRRISSSLPSAMDLHERSALDLGWNELSRDATRTSPATCDSRPDSGHRGVICQDSDRFRDDDTGSRPLVAGDGLLPVVRESPLMHREAEKSSTDETEMTEVSADSEDEDDVDDDEAPGSQNRTRVDAGGVAELAGTEGVEKMNTGGIPLSRGKRPACDGSCSCSSNAHRIKVIRVEPRRRGKGSLPELIKKLKTNRKEAPSPPPPPKEPQQPTVCSCQEPGWLLKQWRDVRIPPLRAIVNNVPRKGVTVANRLSDIVVPDYDQLLALMPENIFDCMSPQNNASSNMAGGGTEDLLDFSDPGDGWPSIDDGLQQRPSHA